MTKWLNEPWLTRPAIKFLEGILTQDSTVLEIGSGSSTVWFAKRVKKITSFEHQEKWFCLVTRKLKEEGMTNCRLHLSPEYPEAGIPLLSKQYDLMLIDGRGRVLSIKTTYKHLKPGGYIMLDDSQRMRYNEGRAFLDSLGWPHKELAEPGNSKTATIWRKPS